MHRSSLLCISRYLFCKLWRAVSVLLRGKVYPFPKRFITRDGAKKERFFPTSEECRVQGLDTRCHFRLIRHSRSRNSGEASTSRYLSIRGEKNFVKKLSLISRLRVFTRELLIISIYYGTFYPGENLKIIIGAVYSMVIQSLRLF